MTSFLLTTAISDFLNSTFANFDYSIFAILGGIQNDVLTALAKIFTAMGSTMYVILFAVMGLVLCFFRRTRKVGLAICFAVIIGTLITNVLVKPMAMRIRPYNTLQSDANFWSWYVGAGMLSESDYGFPSGHTCAAFELAIVLCLAHINSKNKKAKVFCWVFPVIAILVGISRVYLMVHYATDVIGGAIIGIIAGLLGYLVGAVIVYRAIEKRMTKPRVKRSHSVKSAAVLAIMLAWFVCFLFGMNSVILSGGSDKLRCAYNEEYDCQNLAQTSGKYYAIEGQYYCKIHWKELTGN